MNQFEHKFHEYAALKMQWKTNSIEYPKFNNPFFLLPHLSDTFDQLKILEKLHLYLSECQH